MVKLTKAADQQFIASKKTNKSNLNYKDRTNKEGMTELQTVATTGAIYDPTMNAGFSRINDLVLDTVSSSDSAQLTPKGSAKALEPLYRGLGIETSVGLLLLPAAPSSSSFWYRGSRNDCQV